MTRPTREQQAAALEKDWEGHQARLQCCRRRCVCAVSLAVEHTLARRGAEKLWTLLNTEPFVNTLGALTGNQAMQQVKAGLKAIYLSGWQVAADANDNGEMYPDQSLYSVDSVPAGGRPAHQPRLHPRRPDPVERGQGRHRLLRPDRRRRRGRFGGVLNAFELMKAMIEAGAAGVHFEDQLASVKKCGHMGGKVLVPTREAVQARRRAPRRRRDGRAHHRGRPHRRRGAADL